MVGFGEEAFAKEWMEDNSKMYPFPFFLDPEQKVYREFGLKNSLAGFWNFSVLTRFAEMKVAASPAMQNLKHRDGDVTHTLAGDFIADSSGKLVFAHCEETIIDRPSVGEILAALDSAAAISI